MTDAAGKPVEIEALAARGDGGDYFVRIGGSQDENDVRGRLLQRLEEGIGALPRYHVHLIDDIDLVT